MIPDRLERLGLEIKGPLMRLGLVSSLFLGIMDSHFTFRRPSGSNGRIVRSIPNLRAAYVVVWIAGDNMHLSTGSYKLI